MLPVRLSSSLSFPRRTESPCTPPPPVKKAQAYLIRFNPLNAHQLARSLARVRHCPGTNITHRNIPFLPSFLRPRPELIEQ